MHNGFDMDMKRRKLRTAHNTENRTRIGAQIKSVELLKHIRWEGYIIAAK